jgi:putative oxidoreductase
MNSNRVVQVTFFLLRVVAGFLFLQHGGQKLFGWLGGVDGNGATVPLMSLFGLAAVLEFFGGIAIVVGLLTRPVAFILSGEMAVAYFMAHQPKGPLPILNHGESAVLYCFIFLFISAHGAGPWGIDAMFGRGRKAGG